MTEARDHNGCTAGTLVNLAALFRGGIPFGFGTACGFLSELHRWTGARHLVVDTSDHEHWQSEANFILVG